MFELIELVLFFLFIAVGTAQNWRRWAFEIQTTSNRPAVVPWWLPWLGNAMQYGANPYRFLEKCRKKYGPAFTTLLAGRKITFLVEPPAIIALFRNSKDLGFVHLRAEVQERAFATSHEGSVHFAVEGKVYPDAFRHFTKISMSSITSTYSRGVFDWLSMLQKQSTHPCSVSLWNLVFPNFYAISSKASFGASFPENTFSNFVKFDEGFTLLASHIPHAFIGPYHKARMTLISQLVQWTNAGTRAGVVAGTSPLIEEAVSTMQNANFLPFDIGAHLLSLLWGSQGNTIWTAFWYLALLLQDPAEFSRLRNEVRKAIATKFHGNVEEFVDADPTALDSSEFILLDSGLREVLRLSSAFILARQPSTDLTLFPVKGPPIHLVEGETVFVTPRSVHMSEDVYDNPQKFQLDRFVADDGKSLRNFTIAGKLVPNQLLFWGGGPHMCKGRHIAQYQVKIFVALVVHLFDMEMTHLVKRESGKPITGRTLPISDERCLGVMHTDEDILCRLQSVP